MWLFQISHFCLILGFANICPTRLSSSGLERMFSTLGFAHYNLSGQLLSRKLASLFTVQNVIVVELSFIWQVFRHCDFFERSFHLTKEYPFTFKKFSSCKKRFANLKVSFRVFWHRLPRKKKHFALFEPSAWRRVGPLPVCFSISYSNFANHDANSDHYRAVDGSLYGNVSCYVKILIVMDTICVENVFLHENTRKYFRKKFGNWRRVSPADVERHVHCLSASHSVSLARLNHYAGIVFNISALAGMLL